MSADRRAPVKVSDTSILFDSRLLFFQSVILFINRNKKYSSMKGIYICFTGKWCKENTSTADGHYWSFAGIKYANILIDNDTDISV